MLKSLGTRSDLDTDTADRDYYVTIQDDTRTGFLVGPFALHGVAKAHVEPVRSLVRVMEARGEVSAWTAFCSFGTSSVPRGTRVNCTLNDRYIVPDGARPKELAG